MIKKLSFACAVILALVPLKSFADVIAFDTLITVDLSVENQISVTATSGVSAATMTGSDITGIYLDDFFSPAVNSVSDFLVSGDFTSANNTSDNSPLLFVTGGTGQTGLNIFSMASDDPLSFTMGSLAFTGSATWDVNNTAYMAALAGASGGLIYFPADTPDDLANATVLGMWERVQDTPPAIPLPAGVWLLGTTLLGCGVIARRRKTPALA